MPTKIREWDLDQAIEYINVWAEKHPDFDTDWVNSDYIHEEGVQNIFFKLNVHSWCRRNIKDYVPPWQITEAPLPMDEIDSQFLEYTQQWEGKLHTDPKAIQARIECARFLVKEAKVAYRNKPHHDKQGPYEFVMWFFKSSLYIHSDAIPKLASMAAKELKREAR